MAYNELNIGALLPLHIVQFLLLTLGILHSIWNKTMLTMIWILLLTAPDGIITRTQNAVLVISTSEHNSGCEHRWDVDEQDFKTNHVMSSCEYCWIYATRKIPVTKAKDVPNKLASECISFIYRPWKTCSGNAFIRQPPTHTSVEQVQKSDVA